MNRNRLKNPRLMMIVAMTLFGTIGLFVKKIPISSGEISLYRGILAILPIGAVLFLTGQKLNYAEIKKEILLLLLSGAAMGFNWILLFESYKHTTVSLATISYYFAPVLVTIACPIIFKERMNLKQWICFIMSTLGILLITGSVDLSGGSNHLLGISLALGAAVLYASVVIFNKLIKTVEGLHRTMIQFLAAVAVLFPYVAATGGFHITELTGVGWGYLLIVGFIHTGITYCLYFSSLKELPGQKAAILSYIDPLVAVLVSVLILGEGMTVMQVIGGALILGFTLWNEIASRERRQSK
ncbi:MAG: EamA family transporter [Clostridia bacterium]|nr:EamA family transporter [Clostridia bacterium]